MYQAPGMKQRDRGTYVSDECACLLPRHRREPMQVLAVEQFHRVIRTIVVDGKVVHANDVRMRELRERAELVVEQLGHQRALVLTLWKHQALERYELAAVLIEHAIDCTHAARAEQPFNLISRVPLTSEHRTRWHH